MDQSDYKEAQPYWLAHDDASTYGTTQSVANEKRGKNKKKN